MRKYKIIIILFSCFFMLCGCNANNKKISNYEEKINEIINEESLEKRINLILDFEENIKKEEELIIKIDNYSEYKIIKQNELIIKLLNTTNDGCGGNDCNNADNTI